MISIKEDLSTWATSKTVWVVLIVRFLGYGVIFFNPLAGILLSMYLDAWDWDYYVKHGFPVETSYHKIDRLMDFVQYLVMYCFIWNSPIVWIYTAFVFLRLAGMVITTFFKDDDRLFVFFPNVAEYLGILYAINLQFGATIPILSPWIILLVVLFKVWHEYEMYVGKNLEHAIKGKTWWSKAFTKFNRAIIP